MAYSSLAIASVSFLVWGHHMFVSGQSMYAGMIFSMLSFVVAVPSAIKVYNWTATLYKGQILIRTPLLYALGFIGLFVIGGLTGIMLAALAIDVHVHDTYFVVSHFHFIMVGGSVTAYLGAMHFWWPKMTGRMYPEFWGMLAALLAFFGFALTSFRSICSAISACRGAITSTRRSSRSTTCSRRPAPRSWPSPTCCRLFYLLWSLRWGREAGPNPWGAAGLEWTTPSPPPKHNFHEIPVVDFEAYAYPPPEQRV